MKIRNGFVSNSSSSSFAINIKEITAQDMHNIICKYLEKSDEYYSDLKFTKKYLLCHNDLLESVIIESGLKEKLEDIMVPSDFWEKEKAS